MISKTIDISVTSVLQTTAGKMIFGKYDDRLQNVAAAGAPRRELRCGTCGQRAARDQAVGED